MWFQTKSTSETSETLDSQITWFAGVSPFSLLQWTIVMRWSSLLLHRSSSCYSLLVSTLPAAISVKGKDDQWGEVSRRLSSLLYFINSSTARLQPAEAESEMFRRCLSSCGRWASPDGGWRCVPLLVAEHHHPVVTARRYKEGRHFP